MFSLAVVAASACFARSDRTFAYRLLAIMPAQLLLFAAVVPVLPFVVGDVSASMDTVGSLFLSGLFFFAGVTTWLLWRGRPAGLVLLGIGLLNGANSLRLEGAGVASLSRVAALGLFVLVVFRLATPPAAEE